MKILNDRKISSVDDLKALNKNLESFALRVSHDLLSPVNALKTLVSFIEEETKEDSTIEYIKLIKDRVNHLDDIIRNNLKNSKDDSLELNISKIPLEETIKAAADVFSNEMKDSGIDFQLNIRENEAFFSDKFRFDTLLENLIANAVKYHNSNIINKEIVVEGYSDSDLLRISVSDNGIGIDQVFHDRIFDKFFRESSTSQGYGIGLYIVKQTVEMLEGSIKVESALGQGTNFILELKNFKNQK